MPDRPLVIIHGWSDNFASFKPLANRIADRLKYTPGQIRNINLGDYITLDDEVTFDDVVVAMSRAWAREKLPTEPGGTDVIVHSTGGLLVRDWLSRKYKGGEVPIKHLLMLAPANFGSPLAHKGRSYYGRLIKGSKKGKKLFQTGTHILQGLELASPYSWQLAARDRFGKEDYYGKGRILCTVLVGNSGYSGIAAATYDEGTDGTVRASTANMNCAFLQTDYSRDPRRPRYDIAASRGKTAFAVLDGENHSTIACKDGGPVHPSTLEAIIGALTVDDEAFDVWCKKLETHTRSVMKAAEDANDVNKFGYQNMVFLVQDSLGKFVEDYFLEFTDNHGDEGAFAGFFHGDVINTVPGPRGGRSTRSRGKRRLRARRSCSRTTAPRSTGSRPPSC